MENLAEQAYEAFRKHVQSHDFGRTLPPWNDLDPYFREAWYAVAAVLLEKQSA